MNDQGLNLDRKILDAVRTEMASSTMDTALNNALPANDSFGAKPDSFPGGQDMGNGAMWETPKPWEIRPGGTGNLQVYLPAGTSCLFLNGNAVQPASILGAEASSVPGSEDYYDINVADGAGPLVMYRWFEPESRATGRWMLTGAGQWNMATAAPGSSSWKPAYFICPVVVAVKTADGRWMACDSGCMDYEFRVGDAECAAAKYGGTAYAPALKSINSDGNKALQLQNWGPGNSNGTDLSSGPSPALYYSDSNGVGGLIVLDKISTSGDWTVDIDSSWTQLQQIRNDATEHQIAPLLPL